MRRFSFKVELIIDADSKEAARKDLMKVLDETLWSVSNMEMEEEERGLSYDDGYGTSEGGPAPLD